ncbi:uncharacterized protein LOC117898958 [Drosophila subobscura]|uniref:uncharacterized protein LOC117898958 n=1 Tax=Drosophila subobscura TaxID=7241 RepID=UPI00155AD940|nr:uncharacterized protein LOC117898958 [Drosophila subobscura]
MSPTNNSPSKIVLLESKSRTNVRCIEGVQNYLVNAPLHLRPEFRDGAPVCQYHTVRFGFTDSEQWPHARTVSPDVTSETENFRQAHLHRQSRGRAGNQEDESATSFEMRKSSQCPILAEAPVASGRTGGEHVEMVYTKSLYSFADSKNIAPPTSIQIRDQSLSQQTTLHKVTCDDHYGKVTRRIEEPTSVCFAPHDLPPAISRRFNFSRQGQSENLADETMLTLHDDSMPALSTRVGEHFMSSEYPDGQGSCRNCDRSLRRDHLKDERASSFRAAWGSTRQSGAAILHEQTTPSHANATGFLVKTQQAWLSDNLADQNLKRKPQGQAPRSNFLFDEETMTSFANIIQTSGSSQKTIPSSNFESAHRRSRSQSPASRRNEFQENPSSPTRKRSLSHGSISRRQQILEHCQNINDTGEVFPSSRCTNGNARPSAPFRGEAGSTRRRDLQQPTKSNASVNTVPRTGHGHNHHQNQSIPSQNICDESCSNFTCSGGEHSSMQRQFKAAAAQRQSLPSQNISDESEPTIQRPGHGTPSSQKRFLTSQNIDYESDPTFQSTGRGTAFNKSQHMASQNITDESKPTFESTGRGTSYSQRQSIPNQRPSMTTDNKCHESCPTFEGCGHDAGTTQRHYSKPSQNISNDHAPNFQDTSRGTAYTQRQSIPSQYINDESEPKFDSTPRGTVYNQRQSMPSQNTNDESEPTFDSTGRGTAYTQRQSIPSQYINDESEPTFDSTGRETAYILRQSMPSQNINDESEPTFEKYWS